MKYLCALILAVACVGSGCRSLPKIKVIESRPRGTCAGKTYVDSYLNVREIETREVNGDLLQIHLQVEAKQRPWYQRNRGSQTRDVNFQYRCIWLDADGVPLETLTSTWETLALEVGAMKDIVATAPLPTAKDWRMEIRYPK